MTIAGFESRPPGDRPEQGQIPMIGTPIGLAKIEDIEGRLEFPVLATIERKNNSNSVQFTEAIAAVWHKVRRDDSSNSRKVVQFTSAGGAEGKSNISAAFAAAAAHSGQKVLLIDASLRHVSRGERGSLSETVDLGRAAGLLELLRGAVNFGDVARYRSDIHSIVIAAGNIAELGNDVNQLIQLLSSNRARGLFDMARRLFDYIIVDSPPMLLIDPVIISEYCDQVIFVARAETTVQELQYAAKRLARYKRASGIILNQFSLNPNHSVPPE